MQLTLKWLRHQNKYIYTQSTYDKLLKMVNLDRKYTYRCSLYWFSNFLKVLKKLKVGEKETIIFPISLFEQILFSLQFIWLYEVMTTRQKILRESCFMFVRWCHTKAILENSLLSSQKWLKNKSN